MNFFRCPLCHLPLIDNSQGLACVNRHQFDRAKEGYFNLLPVHHKHSREPGDAKIQLQARRDFLRANFFAPLKDSLQSLLPTSTTSLLDVGCGEGYFTSALAERVADAQVYGIDIAKAGVRLAAKAAQQQQQNIFYSVASSFDLPFMDQSMDVITRIYAPSKDEELQRILRPGGLLIIASPGEDHLLGLRQRIYEQVRPHSWPDTPQHFNEIARHTLKSELRLPGGDLCRALLEMTPFAWRIQASLREQLIAQGFVDSLHFNITLYQPRKI